MCKQGLKRLRASFGVQTDSIFKRRSLHYTTDVAVCEGFFLMCCGDGIECNWQAILSLVRTFERKMYCINRTTYTNVGLFNVWRGFIAFSLCKLIVYCDVVLAIQIGRDYGRLIEAFSPIL